MIRPGAPRIHLSDLHLSSAIRIEGGLVNISRCTFRPDRDGMLASRLLTQSAGEVYISESVFANSTAGAIHLTGGYLNLRDTLLRNNSADRGGALRVQAGLAAVSRSRFESNAAVQAGGALHVDGGAVELRDRTLLIGSTAQSGRSIQFISGAVSYALPAPLARYLFVTAGDTVDLTVGAVEADYPFSCPGEASPAC